MQIKAVDNETKLEASWVTGLTVNDSSNTVTGTVSKNPYDSPRSATITLTTGGNSNLSLASPFSFKLSQNAPPTVKCKIGCRVYSGNAMTVTLLLRTTDYYNTSKVNVGGSGDFGDYLNMTEFSILGSPTPWRIEDIQKTIGVRIKSDSPLQIGSTFFAEEGSYIGEVWIEQDQ